jgi:PadR family transcriptional regulator, regulatory protein AphA
MNIRTICLAILAHGEASGYDLKKHWEDGPFFHLGGASFGSIYPALAKLEQEGLVASREETQAGKPPRRVYSLTPAGSKAFLDEMSTTPERDVFRSHFGIIALCAPFLSRESIARAIDDRLNQQRAEVAALEPIIETERHSTAGWLVEWGVTQFKNEIAFLEANRARLEAMAGTAKPGEHLPVCSLHEPDIHTAAE